MFGSDILETAIGIVFVFILISTICSAIREGIEGWLKTRASYLEHGLREMLDDREGTGIVKDLFNHPLIGGLFAGDYKPRKSAKGPSMMRTGSNLPSYIPSKSFALALMDIAARGPTLNDDGTVPTATTDPMVSLAQLRENVKEKISNPTVQRALLTAIDSAHNDLGRAQANIEAWYDSMMERVGGWYKRSTQKVLFWLALALVIGLNINTLTIADYLYTHGTVRDAIVSQAQTAQPQSADGISYDFASQHLEDMHLPIGWSNGWGSPRTAAETEREHAKGGGFFVPYLKILLFPWDDIIQPLIGWMITAFAATLGAPFWFDVLGKISALRSTVKPAAGGGAPQPLSLPAPPAAAPVAAPAPVLTTVTVTPPAHAAPPAAATIAAPSPVQAGDDSYLVGTSAPTTADKDLPPAQGGVAA